MNLHTKPHFFPTICIDKHQYQIKYSAIQILFKEFLLH